MRAPHAVLALAAVAAGTFPAAAVEPWAYETGPSPFKAYVKELRTPSGVQVLLDSPPDHVHHHGLMLALGVEGVDFWGEVPPEKSGRQVARKDPASGVRKTADGAVASQTLDWTLGGTNLLVETRTVTLRAGGDGAPTRVTWRSRLEPGAGRASVALWGRHYFGLGFRFVRDLDGASEFVHPAGATNRFVRGTELLTPGPWCACRGAIGGQQVTVAMFDDPRNPRYPTEWFTMTKPFSYLAATLRLEREPMAIRAGEALDLRWGVALWDGAVPPETVARAYAEWAKEER